MLKKTVEENNPQKKKSPGRPRKLKSERKVPLPVRVTPDLLQLLKEEATDKEETVSTIVEWVLKEHYNRSAKLYAAIEAAYTMQ